MSLALASLFMSLASYVMSLVTRPANHILGLGLVVYVFDLGLGLGGHVLGLKDS